MSKTVDERVVEMRFDNQNFEKNVSTTMSTLDKFKKSLNLTGASKGLENINSAANRINMSGLSGAVETVHAKFSALEVMGVTALANITNSAINAGKNIVNALTLEPVTTGLSEYETKMNAIQVIQANTRGKNTMSDITKALDELNDYADKTIYNFTQMTSNIGKFVAQGQDVQTATNAVKGMANLAAASGASAEDMARATYQMSQALSSSIKLMDWNSLRNANMATVELKNTLIDLARVHGVSIDEMIAKEGSFEQTLQNGWLTGDMFTEAMNIYSGVYSEAELKAKGFNDEQIKNFQGLAETAASAATEVKTLSQLWSVLKETAQSGWTTTWELIFGDFETAKNMFTTLQVYFSNIINKFSDARNALIKGAMASPFGKLAKKIEKVTGATEKMVEVTKDYEEIVNKVIKGDYGNGQSRWDKLAEEGYDWAKVQNLVNEKLGCSVRHTEQLTDAQKKQSKSQKTTIDQLVKMSDAQLKDLGFKKSEIKALRELEEQSKKTGIPLKDLIKDVDQLSGRNLLINSFKNAWSGLVTVVKAVAKAWRNAFPPMTSEQLYNIIAGLHKFSTHLVVSKDTAKKLTRTLKGVFAILDIMVTLTGGALRIAFKGLTTILGYFDMDILSVTASIGDAIVKFRDWFESIFDITKVLDLVVPRLKKVINGIKEWYNGLKDASPEEVAQAIVDGIKNAITAIPSVIESLKEFIVSGFKQIPGDMISGFSNGMSSEVKRVIDIMIELGKLILEEIKGVLGIHSPSTEFFEIGKNVVQGLINGIQSLASSVWEIIKGISSKIVEIVKKIDIGKVLAAVVAGGMLFTVNKLIKVVDKFVSPLDSFASMFDGLGDMFRGIGKNFKASAWLKKSKAILNLAIAIGILAAAVALLCQLDTGKLWSSIGAIAVLAGIMAALSFAASKMGSIDFKSIGRQSVFLLALSASLLILAIAMKKLSGIADDDIPRIMKLLAGIVISVVALIYAFGKFAGGGRSANIDKAGIMLLKMSLALLVMIKVIKLASQLEDDAIVKGLGVIFCLELLFAGIIAVSRLGGANASKAGGMLLKMSIALIIMIGVIKLASMLEIGEVVKGIVVVGAVMILFAGIIAVSTFAGQNAAKAGIMLLLMSVSILILVEVIKMISQLDGGAIAKGLAVITVLEVLFAALIYASMFAGKNAAKAGVMLILMATALLILTGVIFIISQMDAKGLAKGLAVVSFLEILFGGLIAVTHLAEDCKATLIILIVAIGLLVAAVVGLSFLDPSKLATVTACLSSLMGAFALMIAATKLAKNSKKMHVTLLMMLGVVAVLAGIVIALARLDAGLALESTAALSMLLIAFGSSLALIGTVGKISKSVTKNMLVMLAVVTGLAAIIAALSLLDVHASLTTVSAISILLISMSAALILLNFVGPNAVAAVGALALLGLVVAEIAVILGVLVYLDIQPSIETVKALSVLLIAMSASLILLGIVGTMGPAAFVGVAALLALAVALEALIIEIGALMIGIGALMTKFPQLEEFLNKGIPILLQIGSAIGSFFGNIVNSFATAAVAGLPEIGLLLSQFMTNASGFIEGCKNIDSTAMSGVSSLSKAILALTAADFINSIASALTGDSSVADLGTELSNFMTNVTPFIEGLKGVDPTIFEGVEALAKAILCLTAADLLSGIRTFLGGETSFEDFGTQLQAFGGAIVRFSKTVSAEGGINSEAVQAAADAGKIMTELQKSLYGTGGVLQFFAGEKNLQNFGNQLVYFGSAIVNFSKTVSAEGGINSEAIEAAANAGKMMTEMQKSIVGTGEVISWFTGDKNLEKFGTQLTAFGEALVSFSSTVSAKDAINTNAIQAAANAGTLMATLQDAIPEDGWFDGKVSLEDFGKKISKFGEKLVEYSETVSGMDTGAVTTSLSCARGFASLAKKVADVVVTGIDTLADKIGTLATALINYGTNIATLNQSKIAQSIASAIKMANFIKSLSGLNTDGVGVFKSAVSSLAETNMDGFVKTFGKASKKVSSAGMNMVKSLVKGVNTKTPELSKAVTSMITKQVKNINAQKNRFKMAGVAIMNKFTSGMKEQSSKVSSVLTSAISNAVDNTRSYHGSFYRAGAYLVSGFVNGIDNNTFKAKAAAKAMAKAASDAAEKALDEHSPSKVFYRIGDYAGQGFVNALVDNTTVAYKASKEMANSARKGLSKTVSKLQDMLESGINAQPTIRPVLDLSGVESGVNTIGNMLELGSTIGLSADVNGIGSTINQNGSNDDVVSAINKLRGDLGNIGNTTYQVNGITYDDGSNISDAIQKLVRVARIERRV